MPLAPRVPALLALVASLAVPASARAQALPDVQPGARVKVRLVNGRDVEGIAARVTSDTLVLTPDRRPEMAVPIASLRRLTIDRGPRTHGEGAAHGLKVGAIVGGALLGGAVALGVMEDRQNPCGDCWVSATGVAIILGVPVAVTSAVVGTVIGAAAPGRRWERVEVRPGVSLAPGGGTRLGLAVRIR